MRYAIPVTNGKLAAHFGHCEHFAFIDIDPERGAILRKEIVASPGHEPGMLPLWLAEEGVCAVIAGGMGSRAQALFQENRIEVIVGATEEDPEQIVLDHLRGGLAVGDNLCDH
jgi:predicted Fe-Mo cluster-binding NifX family protein